MALKIKNIEVNIVDYSDLEELIESKLSYFSIPAALLANNDSYYLKNVGVEPWDEKNSSKLLEMINNDNFEEAKLQDILDYLAYIEEIPSGTYLIHVSW